MACWTGSGPRATLLGVALDLYAHGTLRRILGLKGASVAWGLMIKADQSNYFKSVRCGGGLCKMERVW
jgi:hypothetical protein